MRICNSCGEEIDDKEVECPLCGAKLIKASMDFSLKENAAGAKKKVGNPMGTSVSTGSGLTDILRLNEEDDYDVETDSSFYSTPAPTTFYNNDVETIKSSRKGGSSSNAVVKFLIFLVIIVALFIGGKYVYSVFFVYTDGQDSYEQVLSIYKDANNTLSTDMLLELTPPYVVDDVRRANEIVDYMKNADIKIKRYEIKSLDYMDADARQSLQEDIKLTTSKTVSVQEAIVIKLAVNAEHKKPTGGKVTKQSEEYITVVKVKGRWFLENVASALPFIDEQ